VETGDCELTVRDDERSGKRVDLVVVERGVVGLGETGNSLSLAVKSDG